MAGAFRKLVENGSIWKICMAGAIIPIAAGAGRASIQSKMEQQQYYTEAMKLVKEYRPLDDFLGEPWRVLWVNRGITSSTSILKDSVALDIPVQGRKDKGTVHVTASRYNDKWVIDKLHIKLKKAKKEWTFYEKMDMGRPVEESVTSFD